MMTQIKRPRPKLSTLRTVTSSVRGRLCQLKILTSSILSSFIHSSSQGPKFSKFWAFVLILKVIEQFFEAVPQVGINAVFFYMKTNNYLHAEAFTDQEYYTRVSSSPSVSTPEPRQSSPPSAGDLNGPVCRLRAALHQCQRLQLRPRLRQLPAGAAAGRWWHPCRWGSRDSAEDQLCQVHQVRSYQGERPVNSQFQPSCDTPETSVQGGGK